MKERIVDLMCMTWRHDFGLDKADRHELSSGMTEEERAALRRDMSQIFEHHVAPLIDQNIQLRAGLAGDFDLDAWLDWAREAKKLRAELERQTELRRLEWNRAEGLQAEVAALRALLLEASDEIACWGAYASDYFQEKHDLPGCVAKFRDAEIAPEPRHE